MDAGAEQLGQLSRDVQAETGALLGRGAVAELLERFEEALLIGGRDADPGVDDVDHDHAGPVLARGQLGDDDADRAGFDGYLSKPIDPVIFVAELERFLSSGSDGGDDDGG